MYQYDYYSRGDYYTEDEIAELKATSFSKGAFWGMWFVLLVGALVCGLIVSCVPG